MATNFVVFISDRNIGNDCLNVCTHEGCDFAAWDTCVCERVTFANKITPNFLRFVDLDTGRQQGLP
jgi:hypothetical protein